MTKEALQTIIDDMTTFIDPRIGLMDYKGVDADLLRELDLTTDDLLNLISAMDAAINDNRSANKIYSDIVDELSNAYCDMDF